MRNESSGCELYFWIALLIGINVTFSDFVAAFILQGRMGGADQSTGRPEALLRPIPPLKPAVTERIWIHACRQDGQHYLCFSSTVRNQSADETDQDKHVNHLGRARYCRLHKSVQVCVTVETL